MNNESAFFQFATKYRGKFWRIAAATRRELEADDVQNEAWLQMELDLISTAQLWQEELPNKQLDSIAS